MRTILFHFPREIGGVPLVGIGWLLILWAVICAARIGWNVRRNGWSTEIWAELPLMAAVAAIIAFVLPALSDEVGLPLRGYGVMLFLGVVSGVALAAYRARLAGYNPELIYSLAFWMCLGGIVGARLFYVIEYWDDFHKPTLSATVVAIANYTNGGLVVYGSFAGGALAAVVFFVRHRLPVLALADLIAPSLTLGLALGRLGCFLNGCCFGGRCDLPWAVQFPPGSPPYVAQVMRGDLVLHGLHFEPQFDAAVVRAIDVGTAGAASGLEVGDRVMSIDVDTPGNEPVTYRDNGPQRTAPRMLSTVEAAAALGAIHKVGTHVTFHVIDSGGRPAARSWTLASDLPVPRGSLPVHPAQLYSAVDALLITFLLLAWYPFRRHEGEVTALMLTIYPVTRFLEEIIRTDERAIFGTGMSISQNVSLLLLAAAVVLWIYVLRSPRVEIAAVASG